MKLQDLQAKGAFVDTRPVKRAIEWKHKDEAGNEVVDTFDVHVVRQAYGTIEELVAGDAKSKGAAMIHLMIRLGENADEQLSYDQAYSLQGSLAAALLNAISEVNGIGDTAKN